MFNVTGDGITIPMQPDEDGYVGRECPECKAYFKIVFGTGLKGTTHCICPYCGHKGDHNQFYTQDQNDYWNSVAEFIAIIRKMGLHIMREMGNLPQQANG